MTLSRAQHEMSGARAVLTETHDMLFRTCGLEYTAADEMIIILCVTGSGGIRKLYETQKHAMLNEYMYHEMLIKLVDRAIKKQM